MPTGFRNMEITGDFGKAVSVEQKGKSLTKVGLEETGGRLPVFCPRKGKCYGSCPFTMNNGKTKDMQQFIIHWTTGSTGMSSLTDRQQKM